MVALKNAEPLWGSSYELVLREPNSRAQFGPVRHIGYPPRTQNKCISNHTHSTSLSGYEFTEQISSAGNHWMASVPHDSLWLLLLEHIAATQRLADGHGWSTPVLVHTGPIALGNALWSRLQGTHRYLLVGEDLLCNHDESCHDKSLQTQRGARATQKSPPPFAVHFKSGTWL